jgi:hypothetical protein
VKKIQNLFLVGLIYILSCSIIYAEPVEGTVMPSKNQWKAGAQINIVKNQDINYIKGSAESKNYFLNLSYGINDWFCIDGKLGVGDVVYKRDGFEKLDYDKGFAGGYGARIKPFYNSLSDIKFILGAHHICVHADAVRDSTGLNQKVIWDGWQLDGIVYRDFNKFIPYIGVKVKKVYLIRRIAGEKDYMRMKSKTQAGGVLGVDYKITKDCSFNFEVRFFDEQAYSAGISYLL